VVPSPRVTGAFARQSETEGRARSTAEAISDALRERIMRGDFQDGDVLPSQVELMASFSASKPSVREALRILEVEGLARVRRGRFGGALVHAPKVDNVARLIEMILRSRDVAIDDVASALQNLEPICAGMCARREDRETAVLPELREVHAESERSVDDPVAFAKLSRRFHESLVSGSGNETVKVMLGAIEAIWSAYAWTWAMEGRDAESEAPVFHADVRARALMDHGYLITLIERGDEDGAIREARQHWTVPTAHGADGACELGVRRGLPSPLPNLGP
jgi:GntR family transcriptional repressor for pyruvate dehydrogenase complex